MFHVGLPSNPPEPKAKPTDGYVALQGNMANISWTKERLVAKESSLRRGGDCYWDVDLGQQRRSR